MTLYLAILARNTLPEYLLTPPKTQNEIFIAGEKSLNEENAKRVVKDFSLADKLSEPEILATTQIRSDESPLDLAFAVLKRYHGWSCAHFTNVARINFFEGSEDKLLRELFMTNPQYN